MNTRLEVHPFSELFPEMTDLEKNELADDIKLHGLIHPIITFEGKILDGRHRYEQCLEVGVEPRFEEYSGDDPLTYVLSLNLTRRHLTASQRAMIAARLENMPPHRPQKGVPQISRQICALNLPPENKGNSKILQTEAKNEVKKEVPQPVAISRPAAARVLGVSERSVTSASKVLKESPALAKAVTNGSISVNGAISQLAKQNAPDAAPPPEFDKVGRVIPAKILPLWKRAAEEARSATDAISKLRCALKASQESDDLAYREMNFSATLAFLNNAFGDYQRIAPHAVCHVCQGLQTTKCTACKERGFVSKFFWERCVPEEFKALIARRK